jgi:hypothetical protein
MGAVISDDGRYRYVLDRNLNEHPDMTGEGTVLFVMLNPSTADANKNDPTIRRCIRFGQRWGYDKLVVANLYALRATNPRALRTEPEPVGAILPTTHLRDGAGNVIEKRGVNINDEWLRGLSADPSLMRVICAWGHLGTHAQRERADRVFDILSTHYAPIKCLGLTKDGFPKHPLARGKHYVSYDDEPVVFDFNWLVRQASRAMERGVGP